jgi:hypothetical protein
LVGTVDVFADPGARLQTPVVGWTAAVEGAVAYFDGRVALGSPVALGERIEGRWGRGIEVLLHEGSRGVSVGRS